MRIHLKDSLGSIYRADVDIHESDLVAAEEITKRYTEASFVSLLCQKRHLRFNPANVIAMWIE